MRHFPLYMPYECKCCHQRFGSRLFKQINSSWCCPATDKNKVCTKTRERTNKILQFAFIAEHKEQKTIEMAFEVIFKHSVYVHNNADKQDAIIEHLERLVTKMQS